jgi:hypothetical protein
MKELSLLQDSDHIVFVINGDRLAAKRTRQVTLSNAEMFVQRALDEGIFGRNTCLKVVVSKWDMLMNDQSFDFEKQVVAPYKAKAIQKVKSLDFGKIAVRPKGAAAGLEEKHGLNDLLNDWSGLYDNKAELAQGAG